MLEFIGSGSAFNTKLGNNGAYYKKDENLFLIDCGSSTFERLIRFNVLDGVEKIYVLITHKHPDHIGSLGDLIFYQYYNIKPMFQKKLIVFAPYELCMRHVLNDVGVIEELYELSQFSESGGIHRGDFHVNFEPVAVTHVKELKCFGYILHIEDKNIYYSGDSNMIPEEIINKLNNGDFHYFYQDTCKAHYEGNVHLSLQKLDELIDYKYRGRVYCMHLDGGFVVSEAEELGFNVVKNIEETNRQ